MLGPLGCDSFRWLSDVRVGFPKLSAEEVQRHENSPLDQEEERKTRHNFLSKFLVQGGDLCIRHSQDLFIGDHDGPFY